MLQNCVKAALDVKFDALRVDIEKISGGIHDIECKLEEQATELNECKKLYSRMEECTSTLTKQMDNLEQYSRRNCVRVSGVEETGQENTDQIILDIAANRLGITLNITDIDRSHRIGHPRNTTSTRAIIVKFTSYRSRAMFIGARRKLKGSKIVITEDLTRRNQDLLYKARNHPGVKTAWSHDGNIIVLTSRNGTDFRKKIMSENDLSKL